MWHGIDVEAACARLGVDPRRGLSTPEARLRLERHGPNRLREGGRAHWPVVLARQFTDVLVLLLAAAAAVSLLIGHLGDALAILAILALNGALGFVQEWRAERALAALRRLLAPRCRVRRDGALRPLDAEDLVPGDVVELALGDRVPADLRVVEAHVLRTDEAVLTGESVPVSKGPRPVPADTPLAERTSMAWMGTTVAAGRATGVVTATGMASAFGRIASLAEGTRRERTPLQGQLAVLSRHLAVYGLAVAALVAGVGFALGLPLASMFFTGVSLAVAVVPEGLPAVVTLTLALGVRSMASHRALVRRLAAAETLGAATVICTDKTGTLTQGEMTVQEVWTAAGAWRVTGVGHVPAGRFERADGAPAPQPDPDVRALLETGLHCNRAVLSRAEDGWQVVGEPTEGALVVAAAKAGLEPPAEPPCHEVAFDSDRKRMTVVERRGDACRAHVKGAPEVLLERAARILEGGTERPLEARDRAAFQAAYEAMAARGLRTLALARRALPGAPPPEADALERDLTLLGLVGIIDPPRPEVPGAVALAHAAGIRVLMLTGDAPGTARAVADQIGLTPTRTITGSELEQMDDAALAAALGDEVLFARTAPEHKLRLVRALQARGEVVAMTGDGVNDAPALKRADIGVAMGVRGTDVARAAADIVLADDDFASIVSAAEEGRRQHANIRRFVRYLLSSNTGEVLAIFVALVSGAGLLLLPVQILWMNLMTDSVTAVALGLEPAHPGTMRRPPRKRGSPILPGRDMPWVAVLGAAIAAVTLAVFWLWGAGVGPGRVQTAAFTAIIVAEKINVLNFRALRAPMRSVGWFTNPWLLVALVCTLGVQACAVYVPFLQRALHTVPLPALDWLWFLLFAIPIFLVPEALKRHLAARA